MRACDTCGNHYDKMMTISVGGTIFHFDCFECAMHALAPVCLACGVRILGHGVESGNGSYCSAHCARGRGEAGFCDHVREAPAAAPGMENLISFSALRKLASTAFVPDPA